MSLKVITIDFWNTIFNSANGEERTYERERVVAEEIAKLGKNVPKEVLKDAFHEAWNFFNEEWLNNQRTPTTKELVHHFWAHLQLVENHDTARLLEKAFAEGILDYPPALMPGVAEALKTLSQKYKLALISDTAFSPGSILKELMESVGIAQYFSAYSFSDETGVAKPHEFAYNKVLKELDCEPQDALHIGDIEKTDILGAKNLGMKAILYKGDKDSPMNIHAEENTQADFTAESWDEIVEILLKD